MTRAITCFTLLLLFTCTAFGANFTVTKIADTNDGTCDADCSLREAIAAANVSVEGDVIAFSSLFDSAQTIVLSGSEIIVANTGSLTIDGPGASLLTIDGNNTSRILSMGAGVVANISDLTFTRGNGVGATDVNSGGALRNDGGTVTVSNVVFTNNVTSLSAGAIRNDGGANLTINNCVFANNRGTTSSGGAIQNFSTASLTISNSTFTGNQAAGTVGGGAIQGNGQVRIANSTFHGNSSSASGGAIQSNGSLLLLTNVTITGNTSTSNGGGLHRGTTNVNGFIRNSIIAGNTGTAASPDVTNSAGGLASQGNNIIGTVGTSTGWVASDLLGIDPMLGPLADNGGFSQTRLPQAGSPAINAGQNCVVDASCSANNPVVPLTTDQRGVARPQGATVDIGAVEVAAAPTAASVSGRVLSSVGSYVPRAIVTISNPGGVVDSAATNSFGYFTFTGIPTGQTYTINVQAKGYTFAPLSVPVTGDVTGVVMTSSGSPFHVFKK